MLLRRLVNGDSLVIESQRSREREDQDRDQHPQEVVAIESLPADAVQKYEHSNGEEDGS